MTFHATKQKVLNRGIPSDAWLTELVGWLKDAPEEIFAPNAVSDDIYTRMRSELGPWKSILHRRAAMGEAMRVHAGFESSWNWNLGVDTTNKTSMSNIRGQETGAWQVSFDSTNIAHGAMKPFAEAHDVATPEKFITDMKRDHKLAMEYYARLVRVNIKWAGPIVRNEFQAWLKRDAVTEFESLLS